MTKYIPFDIHLTDAQIKTLQKPGNAVLRFSKEQLATDSNGNKLLLTQSQVNRIKKCGEKNKGLEIKLSKRQLQKNQSGGFLPLLATVAKFAAPVAVAALSGIASSLASKVGDKIVGKSVKLIVPKNDLDELEEAVGILESKNILPNGSRSAIKKDIDQKGGAFVLPLVASLLGTFLPTLFNSKNGKGIFLPWEKTQQ